MVDWVIIYSTTGDGKVPFPIEKKKDRIYASPERTPSIKEAGQGEETIDGVNDLMGRSAQGRGDNELFQHNDQMASIDLAREKICHV